MLPTLPTLSMPPMLSTPSARARTAPPPAPQAAQALQHITNSSKAATEHSMWDVMGAIHDHKQHVHETKVLRNIEEQLYTARQEVSSRGTCLAPSGCQAPPQPVHAARGSLRPTKAWGMQ
jgi:hypothetical protein